MTRHDERSRTMAVQHKPGSDSQGANPRSLPTEQPLNRRRALRVLSALAAAAASAAVLSTGRPEEVRADGIEGPTTFTAQDGTAVTASNNSGAASAIAGVNFGQNAGVAGVNQASMAGVGVEGSAFGMNSIGVFGVSDSGSGVLGFGGPGTGVWGKTQSDSSAGVYGLNSGKFAGVLGRNTAGGPGVYGDASANGGAGVLGITQDNAQAGVEGTNFNNGPSVFGNPGGGGIGVLGHAANAGSAAVQGIHYSGGPGVVGFSGTGTGVGGGSGTGIGFGGVAVGAGGIGVAGQATDASGYAGVFTGGKGVLIQGNLTVTGSFPKSAAVRGADGMLKRLYSLECPESWFEDFGTAQLSNGSARVELEPGFAGVVKTDQYRVFPVANGDCKGLYISNRTPTSFTVHESQGGTSNVAFDYRIVAKRKDIAGVRLEHVDEPPAIDLSKLAQPPTTPTAPPTPPGHGG
jgi:hypothetical protein